MNKEENKKINYLKELTEYKLFLDNILIKDKTARQILVTAYNKLKRQQKEIEEYKIIRNMLQETQMKLFEERKEVEKYKRYFKLAINDLKSEGYMQMPYENIEEYYSQREDIV